MSGEAAYLLDGEPLFGSLDEFLTVNTFDAEETAAILSLKPGERFDGGGGAWAGFVLERVS